MEDSIAWYFELKMREQHKVLWGLRQAVLWENSSEFFLRLKLAFNYLWNCLFAFGFASPDSRISSVWSGRKFSSIVNCVWIFKEASSNLTLCLHKHIVRTSQVYCRLLLFLTRKLCARHLRNLKRAKTQAWIQSSMSWVRGEGLP